MNYNDYMNKTINMVASEIKKTEKKENCPNCGEACSLDPQGKVITDDNCSDCVWCGTNCGE